MTTERGGLAHRLYHGETSYDFIGRARLWFIISAAVIVIGLASLFTRGLNFGIDFKGGSAWDLPSNGVSVADARSELQSIGLGDSKIQILGGNTLHVQAEPQKQETIDKVTDRLAKLAKVPTAQVSVNSIGPSWGGAVTRKAERALVFFFIAIAIYISFRFEWKMAVAALSAVVHDILVTVGIYSLSGFAVTPATVIAFLTILGYSLYDTIVVFDKVEENTRGLAASGRLTYGETVNLSMNQVLMRSLNTSLVAILPIVSVLVIGVYGLGATTLEDFGLALLIGLLTGAYSSIFIASPILAILKEREPRYSSIRQRIESKGARATPLTPAAAMAESGGLPEAGDDVAASVGGGGSQSAGARAAVPNRPRPNAGRPPKGRKKGKRR
jgi:preprotein translocase subunit SecF